MWQVSKPYKILCIVLLLVTMLLVVLIGKLEYFPGDIIIAQFIQNALQGYSIVWANYLSNLAEFPYSIGLVLITLVLSFYVKGAKASILSLISFFGLLLIDKLIKLFIFQVRPSGDIIFVDKISSTSAFPSTSGIVYIATFGFLMLLSLRFFNNSILNKSIFLISAITLIAIFLARVVLGAHWPSDMIVTYLLGTVWIMLLLPFLTKTE